MIIDSHQHFWKYNPIRDSWMEDMPPLQQDFYPKDLAPILEKNNVSGCITIQADCSEDETNFLLSLTNEYKFIKGVVGWVDLCSEKVEESLDKFSENNLLKGIRHVVQAEPLGYMLNPNFQNGIKQLEKYNLTYDILVFQHQLEDAITLSKKFPSQKFVLDHIAKPQISKGINSSWKKQIKKLAELPNIYCKLSGMVTETENFKWEKSEFTPFMDIVFDAFGIDRVMFGSDWPVCLASSNYSNILSIIKEYIDPFFSKDEKDKILGKNTLKFYNI